METVKTDFFWNKNNNNSIEPIFNSMEREPFQKKQYALRLNNLQAIKQVSNFSLAPTPKNSGNIYKQIRQQKKQTFSKLKRKDTTISKVFTTPTNVCSDNDTLAEFKTFLINILNDQESSRALALSEQDRSDLINQLLDLPLKVETF